MDYTPLKKTLGEMLEKRKQEKAQEEHLRSQRNDEDRNKILENVGKDFGTMMEPHLKMLQDHSKMSSEELKRIISESVQVSAPNVDTAPIVTALQEAFGNFRIPEPRVNVAAPIIPAPIVNLPPAQVNFPSVMKALLEGVDRKNPLPVMMVDLKGNPFYDFGGGSGSHGPTILSDFINKQGFTLIDSTTTPGQPALRISGSITAAAASSVSLVNSDGVYYNSDNPFPVSFTAASSQNVNIRDASGSSVTSFGAGDSKGLAVGLIDDAGNMLINKVSGYNSTTTTFAGGGVFTGLSEDVKNFSVAQISVFADQVSAADGLSVQQSSDGTNWDITDVYNIPASTGKTFNFQIAARYLRVVYTNGATPQGAFRLQTVYHVFPTKDSSQRSSDGLSNENDFTQTSAYLAGLNPSGNWDRLRTNVGTADGALRVVQASDATASVSVVSQGVTLQTQQVSGATDSVFVVGPIAQGDAASALRVVVAGNSDSSVSATQVGTWNIGTLTSITNSAAVSIVDSSGAQYSGSNPVPITLISGALTSTVVVGDTLHDAPDVGAAPLKMGGVAMTTNPTAVADGDRVNFRGDDLGRQIMRPYQVRDLTLTAYVSLANGTETTLLAASAGNLHDLMWIMAANTSSTAQQIDIREATGGNIVMQLYIPANSTAGIAPSLPWPQSSTGNNWTVDNADVTNSTINITALFVREV